MCCAVRAAPGSSTRVARDRRNLAGRHPAAGPGQRGRTGHWRRDTGLFGCDACLGARNRALPHSPSHPDGHPQHRAAHHGVAQPRADQPRVPWHRNAGACTRSGLDTHTGSDTDTRGDTRSPRRPHPHTGGDPDTRGDTRTGGDADTHTHTNSHRRTHTHADGDTDTHTVSVLDAAGGSHYCPRARTGSSSHGGSAGSDLGSGRRGTSHR